MLALVVAWLIAAFFVFRFVVWTGGSPVGRVGHFFGGTSVMLVIAVGMLWLYALGSPHFAGRMNVYVKTHLLTRGSPGLIVRIDQAGDRVTVYRHAEVNNEAILEGAALTVDETTTVHTSWWWMLWDAKYDQNSGIAK